jgi:hypothetical protein
MSESYSISLALLDFVPNIAFLIGAYFLVRIIVMARGQRCGRMAMVGAMLIVLGGTLKAAWKLLYAANIADVRLMSEIQFVLLAPGFLALLTAVVLMARRRAVNSSLALMAIAPWKLPLLMVMVVTSLGAHGILTYISFRRGARLAAVGFIIAFLGILMMGGMASGEQSVAMQWIEESVNTVGQLGFMAGSILLHKNYQKFGC